MAGKVKFDQEAAFNAIIAPGREVAQVAPEKVVIKAKSTTRVQRSYFLDRDIDKALRRMALEEERNLTESVNDILRRGLEKYLK